MMLKILELCKIQRGGRCLKGDEELHFRYQVDDELLASISPFVQAFNKCNEFNAVPCSILVL
jgi:hypothetical protein